MEREKEEREPTVNHSRMQPFANSTTHQKDGHPGQPDVVERDGPVEWVPLPWPAVGVVHVPVDAVRVVPDALLDAGAALHVVLLVGREVGALVHPGAVGHGADEVLLAAGVAEEVGVKVVAGREEDGNQWRFGQSWLV